MRVAILFSLLSLSAAAQAQRSPYYEYDFSSVDPTKISLQEVGVKFDSLWRMSGADSLVQLAAFIKKHTTIDVYTALDVGYEFSNASFRNLNRDLVALGFGEVRESFDAVLWGFTGKTPGWLYSIHFVIGLSNKTSNDQWDLSVSGGAIDFAAGYNILKSQRLQLYPQVAIGYQGWWIESQRKDAGIADDLGTLLSEASDPHLHKSMLLFTYGAEADYHVRYSRGENGIIIGLKYGLTADIIEGKWKLDGKKTGYNSSDRLKESRLAVIVRFYFK